MERNEMNRQQLKLMDDIKTNITNIGSHLEKNGSKFLGNGYFARVYTHPTDKNKVIKIGPLYLKDDGWIAYAKLVLSMKNRHISMPNIFSLKENRDTGYYIAVMERLQNHCNVEFNIPEDITNKWNFFDSIDRLMRYECKKTADLIEKCGHGYLNELLWFLRSFREKCRISSDLHSDNIMLRNGTLVITDPFYNTNKTAIETISYLKSKRT